MPLLPEPADDISITAHANESVTRRAAEVASTDFAQNPEDTPRPGRTSTGPLAGKKRFTESAFWQKWYAALKCTLPVYIAIHLALFVLSCLAFLYVNKDFSGQIMPVATLWQQWRHWDSNFYIAIATEGYAKLQYMAFFPLYPMLTRGVMAVVGSPVIAGMLVSNVAELLMFMVLYRLVEEDFGAERAYYAILYFAIFPSAFILSAVYTEALFLCLSVLSFYQIRHGRWWLAGIFACGAGLTRPDGIYLIIPFCYEYLSRIWQRQNPAPGAVFAKEQILRILKGLRFDFLYGLLFFVSMGLFIAYGYVRFHDPLAFMHASSSWNRFLSFPGLGIVKSTRVILAHSFLSFTDMRNGLELGTDLFMLLIIVLSFIGPWKFSPRLWGYGLYALALYLYFQLFPVYNAFPLESMTRFLLEIFPAFILLAGLRKSRLFHLSYCLVAGALLFFLLTQFLLGHWIT